MRLLRNLALALVSCVLAACVSHLALWPLDTRVYDIGAVSYAPREHKTIEVLGIDEAFMQGRHAYITPRDRLARLLDAVTAALPRAVVIDVWLDSRVDARGDTLLRDALLRAKTRRVPVFLVDIPLSSPTQQSGLTAHGATLPFFRDAAAGAGDATFLPDADDSIRLMPRFNGLPFLPLLAAEAGAVNFDRTLKERLQNEPIPISWQHEIKTTPAMTFVEQPFLAALLEGKAVFIGATYPRSQDVFHTPRDILKTPPIYGVQLQALAATTLQEGAPRRTHTSRAAILTTAFVSFCFAFVVVLFARRGAGIGIAATLVFSLLFLALAVVSARDVVPLLQNRYWAPSVPLLSVLCACGLAVAERSREQARELKLVSDAFGAYVGDDVLQALGGRMPELGGEVRFIAVLFCDIRGYSALAERLQNDPSKLMHALNEHFEPLVEALKKRGAYADNYVGDLVMALFGAPISQGPKADVQNAVAAAHDFVRLVEERNALRRGAGEEPIEVGIGLHCGEAVVGNLGSKRKIHYTAIGDVVNIASRVESATRKYDVPLLVTEEIVQAAEGTWEFVEETTVKGRAAPVRLYRAL